MDLTRDHFGSLHEEHHCSILSAKEGVAWFVFEQRKTSIDQESIRHTPSHVRGSILRLVVVFPVSVEDSSHNISLIVTGGPRSGRELLQNELVDTSIRCHVFRWPVNIYLYIYVRRSWC
jgi:hypothetical protein